jgi:protein-tyrosine-phosphatase
MTTWPTDFEARRLLDEEVRRLNAEFAGIYDPATVRDYVDRALDVLPEPRFPMYLPALAARYARELLRSAARWQGKIAAVRPQVLFVCVHNAGRSQMAAAFARHLSHGQLDVLSAGSTPADEIHDNVHAAMQEVGIDLAQEFPKRLSDDFVRASDAVVTMGCGDACPVYPGKRYEDWKLDDPAGKGIAQVRVVRDEIRTRVEALLRELGVEAAPPAAVSPHS